MEKIVYLLGAGFSTPLGLPVMGNFLAKSKDLYFANRDKYPYFPDIFEKVARMSIAKNYYGTDLFNIEEILSIWEMENSIGSGNSHTTFVDYLSDVITAHTPDFSLKAKTVQDFITQVLTANDNYAYFVGNIMNAKTTYGVFNAGHNQTKLFVDTVCDTNPEYSYAIVSLNYDMVLEGLWDAIKGERSNRQFGLLANKDTVCLAKLHGSVGEDLMIAPTWNKTIKATEAWSAAYNVLKAANQIRIIGYSLPVADAYVKYLLKAAVIYCENLKQIDIILKGNPKLAGGVGSEIQRYRDFIHFANTRISTEGVVPYIKQLAAYGGKTGEVDFNKLEDAHKWYSDTHFRPLHS